MALFTFATHNGYSLAGSWNKSGNEASSSDMFSLQEGWILSVLIGVCFFSLNTVFLS